MSSYHVPTNLELVEKADAIILARVADGGPGAMEGFQFRRARLVPVTLLKGRTLPIAVKFDDAILSGGRLKAVASDARNLVDANPDAFSGSCNRIVFKKDMLLVVFLKRDNGSFVPYAPPFSRALEDVPSPNALWVKAVKLYTQIAAVPGARRLNEMKHRRDLLQFNIDKPDSRLLALELDRALHERR